MSKTSKLQSRYVGVLNRGNGIEAIEIKLDYDFWGKGIILPPVIKGFVGSTEVEFVLVDSQSAAAKAFSTSQQQMSRWIRNHEQVIDMQLDSVQGDDEVNDKASSHAN